MTSVAILSRMQKSVISGATAVLASAVVSACGSGGQPGADAVLRTATHKTLSAPYLVVSSGRGRQLLFSPNVTAIKRGGQLAAWTTTTEELTWDRHGRCFARTTEFNRADAPDERRAVAPTKAGNAHLEQRDGTRVVTARETHSDFADTEFESHLDPSGRLAIVRQRSARFGAIPAGRWETARYVYPTAAEFARLVGLPKPRCR